MLTLSVNSPLTDRTVVVNRGTMAFSESLQRTDGLVESRPSIVCSGITVSGIVTHLHLDLWEASKFSTSLMQLYSGISAGESFTIDAQTYTFIGSGAAFSDINQVKISSTALLTARNVYRVMNTLGTAGVDYYVGQSADPDVRPVLPDNPLLFRALVSGTVGNELAISTASPNVALPASYLYGGESEDPMVVFSQSIVWTGLGTYLFDPIAYSKYGNRYMGSAYLMNNSVAAVNTSGLNVVYDMPATYFTGRSSLTEFAEVTGISGVSLVASGIDSSGKVMVNWDDMNYRTTALTLNLASPNTTGTPTQDTRLYSYEELGQAIDYYVFIFIGSSAPQRVWPRTTDSNGTWYFAGRTQKTYTTINVPKTGTIGIWVGFGNRMTLDSTVTPITNKHPQVYLV